MYTRNTNSGYKIKTEESLNTDAVGDIVCVSAAYRTLQSTNPNFYTLREGSRCGTLTAVSSLVDLPGGHRLINQREVAFTNTAANKPAVRSGDSGAPVVKNPDRAVGIVSAARTVGGAATEKFLYSHIGHLKTYGGPTNPANSASGINLRVLKSRGPGGGDGDVRCVSVPGEPTLVPGRLPAESYTSYAQCLTQLGLTPVRDTKAIIDADIDQLPDAVLDTTPASGTSVAQGTAVTVKTNPQLTGAIQTASTALGTNNPDAAQASDFGSRTAPLVAQACLKLAAKSRTITEDNDRLDDDKMPDTACGNATTRALPIFLTGTGVPEPNRPSQLEATQHDIDALGLNPDRPDGAYPGWFRLNWDNTPRSSPAWYIGENETGTQNPCQGSLEQGTQCDEFPFSATLQGGRPAIPEPHLRVIGASGNQSQGGSLVAFKNNCLVENGVSTSAQAKPFLVVPSRVLPTSSVLCSAGPSGPNP